MTLVLLALIVVVGAGLRFYGLELQSLWLDEILTWNLSGRPVLGEVIDAAPADHIPPAYPILMFYVIRCLGDSEVMLRLPSAVAGVLAIPMIYLLGARIYSRREGLVAALLMAFSITPIRCSQEARVYSILLLLLLVSFYFWFELVRALESGERPSWTVQLGYVTSAIAAGYLHYFGILVIVLQGVGLFALFALRLHALSRVVVVGAPVAGALLGWLPELLRDSETTRFWIREPSFDSIRDTWTSFFLRPGELKRLAAVLCGVYLARTLWVAWRGPQPAARSVVTSPTFAVVLWLVLPFVFAFIWSRLMVPILHERYLVVSLPAAYLLFAGAFVHTVPYARAQAALGGALAVMLLYGVVVSGRYYADAHKEQFREAAALVAAHDHEYPGAAILARSNYAYYLRRFDALDRLEPVFARSEERGRVADFLDRNRPEYVWLLLARDKADEEFLAFLEWDYRLLRYDAFVKAWVRLYQRR